MQMHYVPNIKSDTRYPSFNCVLAHGFIYAGNGCVEHTYKGVNLTSVRVYGDIVLGVFDSRGEWLLKNSANKKHFLMAKTIFTHCEKNRHNCTLTPFYKRDAYRRAVTRFKKVVDQLAEIELAEIVALQYRTKF